MNIPAHLLNPRETAPKDRAILIYSPEMAPYPEIVELVIWSHITKSHIATGAASTLEYQRNLEDYEERTLQEQHWPVNSFRPWFWAECSDIAQ